MSHETDEKIAPESSTEAAISQDVSAEPSAAQDQGVESKSLSEAVNAALVENQAPAEPPAATNPENKEEAKPEDEANKDEQLPFHKHPRFQELIKEKNEYKSRIEEMEKGVEEVKTKATQYDGIVKYCNDNGLKPEDVQKGFELMATFTNDPAAFVKAIAPYLQHAAQFTGDVLPQDIQQEVDNGYMTLDRARELAALRAQHQSVSTRYNETIEQQRVRQQQEALQRAVNANQTAVNQWEERWKATDPDYEQKSAFVLSEYKAMVMNQPPRSPQEAIGMAEEAKRLVEAKLRKVLPARSNVTTIPSGRSASATVTQTPKSLREAVDFGLRAG